MTQLIPYKLHFHYPLIFGGSIKEMRLPFCNANRKWDHFLLFYPKVMEEELE